MRGCVRGMRQRGEQFIAELTALCDKHGIYPVAATGFLPLHQCYMATEDAAEDCHLLRMQLSDANLCPPSSKAEQLYQEGKLTDEQLASLHTATEE